MGTFFVIKRDGSRIGFEIQRIINAIKKAAQAVGIQDERFCHDIAQKVSNDIFAHHQQEIDISHIQKNCRKSPDGKPISANCTRLY